MKYRSAVAILPIVALLVAGCAGSQNNESDSKWGKPKANGTYDITYLVKGVGVAMSVSYKGANYADTEKDNVPLPWGTTVSEPAPDTSSDVASINAVSPGDSTISCEIWINGKRFAAVQNSASAYCQALPF